jgi:NAD(P)H-dependent FMN reductase
MMHLLALTGSLRARSINTELLRAAALLAPDGTSIGWSDALGLLPHFNPDLDGEGMTPPPAVTVLRDAVAQADALIVCCPEYAHGIAGAFKNLLDWLVSSPVMVGKPVCVLNASSGSRFGPESLAETLRTMSAIVVTGGPITVPINGRLNAAVAIAADGHLSPIITRALAAVADAVAAAQTSR